MIIIADKQGQLGNRLVNAAHFLAFCREYKVDLFNPAFEDYFSYFEKTKEGNFFFSSDGNYSALPSGTFKHHNLKAKVYSKLGFSNKMISSIALDWNESVTLDKEEKRLFSKTCYVRGWEYRAGSFLSDHTDFIKGFFQPEISYQKKIDAFIHSLGENILPIGIHIRHGDYKKFEGGKYFFEVDHYKKVISHIHQLLRKTSDKKIVFVISTNSDKVKAEFGNENFNYCFAPGHELVDMYVLSRCAYIAGPPSTYSIWASFYGDVQLHMLKNDSLDFSLKDFKVYNRM